MTKVCWDHVYIYISTTPHSAVSPLHPPKQKNSLYCYMVIKKDKCRPCLQALVWHTVSAVECRWAGLWGMDLNLRTHEFCSIMLLHTLTCGYCSRVTGIPDDDKQKSMSASHKPQTSSFRELKSGFIWIGNAFGWIDYIHNKLWSFSCESEICSKHAMHLQQHSNYSRACCLCMGLISETNSGLNGEWINIIEIK